ncbi:putative membrane protein [Citrobacter freundii]|uniref:Membrane protein n=1 Tax=Citrobacter freundii TaxID=546 RepID=A0A7G2IVK4_CITFR|nr:putative membrane protein [Citrobacter freundii]
MSVVYQQRAARRRWLTLWPLAVFFVAGDRRGAVVVAGLASGNDAQCRLAARR